MKKLSWRDIERGKLLTFSIGKFTGAIVKAPEDVKKWVNAEIITIKDVKKENTTLTLYLFDYSSGKRVSVIQAMLFISFQSDKGERFIVIDPARRFINQTEYTADEMIIDYLKKHPDVFENLKGIAAETLERTLKAVESTGGDIFEQVLKDAAASFLENEDDDIVEGLKNEITAIKNTDAETFINRFITPHTLRLLLSIAIRDMLSIPVRRSLDIQKTIIDVEKMKGDPLKTSLKLVSPKTYEYYYGKNSNPIPVLHVKTIYEAMLIDVIQKIVNELGFTDFLRIVHKPSRLPKEIIKQTIKIDKERTLRVISRKFIEDLCGITSSDYRKMFLGDRDVRRPAVETLSGLHVIYAGGLVRPQPLIILYEKALPNVKTPDDVWEFTTIQISPVFKYAQNRYVYDDIRKLKMLSRVVEHPKEIAPVLSLRYSITIVSMPEITRSIQDLAIQAGLQKHVKKREWKTITEKLEKYLTYLKKIGDLEDFYFTPSAVKLILQTKNPKSLKGLPPDDFVNL